MKRIFISLVIVLLVGTVASKATLAVWSDSGASSGNTFAAGTLDLKLSDSNETDQDSVTATWTGTGMTPGGSTITGTLNLKNAGSPAADHVHLSFASVITEGPGAGAPSTDPMTKHLQVTSLSYDGGSILGLINDSNANGYIDLQDLTAAGIIGANTGAGKLNLMDMGVNHPFVMSVKLNIDSPDQNQGDSVATTVTATLHQADGQ